MAKAIKAKSAAKTIGAKGTRQKAAAAPTVRPRKTGSAVDQITVRMYCHGFGDCFLLSFLEKGEMVYCMLVDCGMLTGNTDLLKQALSDIKGYCGGRLDVVVQTHQHKDHISGFNLRDNEKKMLWNTIEVDQVWLAWTENTGPDGDGLAIELKERQRKKERALEQALSRYNSLIKDPEYTTFLLNEYRGEEYLAAQKRYALALDQLLNFAGIGSENEAVQGADGLPLTMEDAMNYFKQRQIMAKGMATAPYISYWNPGDMADEKRTGLHGIRFYFLGPPKDYSQLRIMEDRSHADMYFSEMGLSDNFYLALSNTQHPGGAALSPFNAKYIWDTKKLSKQEMDKKENQNHIKNLYQNPRHQWRQIEADWLHNAGALALHLDSYTNNTSLVFAIEFIESGKVLLFPADAQIGNWVSWTAKDPETRQPKLQWQVKQDNEKRTITASDLLERTVFYKVGHHGSHNATAKKHGLELMKSDELVAMIPVDEDVARNQGKRGWKMPAEKLYDRLLQKTRGRIIRLDQGSVLKDGIGLLPVGARPTQAQLEAFNRQYSESAASIQVGENKQRPLYVEFIIEC